MLKIYLSLFICCLSACLRVHALSHCMLVVESDCLLAYHMQVSRQLHTVYQLWCNQSSLELVQWLQDNCQPLGVVGQEVAQEESMDDITQGEEKQYDRITEMEGEPSRQQENGIISSCSVAESRDEMHMDGKCRLRMKYICLCLSVCLSVCLFVCLFVCLSVCLSVCLCVFQGKDYC